MYNKLQQRASPCTRYQVWLKKTAVAPNTFPRKTRRKDHQKRPKQVYTVGHEQGKRTCFDDLSVLNSVMKN